MTFTCVSCGYRSIKWMGFCPQCRHDAPLQEMPDQGPIDLEKALPLTVIGEGPELRRATGVDELDRVLGGGLVAGSTVLLGGEPGVGKSTLLLQAAGALAALGGKVLIATAEESARQIGLRADRLAIKSEDVLVLADSEIDRILATAGSVKPDLLVVDSIQTISSSGVDGTAGGSAQVRESSARLMRFAKEQQVAVVLIGHVTKDGSIAGPKLVEHMVDVVLYFEGDPDHGLRALRSLKNRFGATHVVGMFDMTGDGLTEVKDPSRLFLAGWQHGVPGTVVFPAVEGRRAILVEVQALAVDTSLPQPRRSVRGVDPNRVHQILAVIHRRIGLRSSDLDIYVNVVGGWKIDEPACDLAVALAIFSAISGEPLGSTAAWGEVGLTGEVRSVPFHLRRLQEAERMGIERLIVARAASEHAGGVSDLQAALLEAGLR
ncbi:MAG TPA: DNA repair protein RadA [Acidimicrobiia bacterium]|nr:DNA repair protein RadA [Acidimicrobiia bacterium]